MSKKIITLLFMVAMVSYGYAQIVGMPQNKEHALLITKNFEDHNEGGTTHRHYYGKTILTEMLNLTNAAKGNVINTMDGNGLVHLIFKISDQDGQIINQSYAFEDGSKCPPSCPPKGSNIKAIGGKIDEGKAQQWANNFQLNLPERASLFSFDVAELKKILSVDGAAGMFFAYGQESTGESMIVGAVDNNAQQLWDNYLAKGKGEKSNALYPAQNIVKKN